MEKKMPNQLSTNLDYIMSARFGGRVYTPVEAAARCRKAGFTALDFTPDTEGDHWQERVLGEGEAIRAMGMELHQSHAPFNRYTRFPEAVFHDMLKRHLESLVLLGIPQTVMHGNEYGHFENGYDSKAAADYVYDFLAPHVEYAVRHGIIVNIENLMEGRSFPEYSTRRNYTACTEEVLELIERFHDPMVRCCWDFGHAHVAYADQMLDELKKVGPLLSCTHVHDNYYEQDLHLPPFMGDVDWKSNMRYLYESGYTGDVTFELVYGHIPEAFTDDFLANLYRTGEYLLALGAEA